MDLKAIYHSLYLIRRSEEEVARLYPTDKIKSPVHLSIGQEAVSVAVCQAIRPSDPVFGTYRSHALYLAKTDDLKGFFAELYGKRTGCSMGKGGSMHLANFKMGMMGTSAVVATTIPQAVGYAYAVKQRKEKKLVTVFFGDGATEEGVFYESLNFAALKSLPILFVCENNRLAIHTHQNERQASRELGLVPKALGITSSVIKSGDTFEIFKKVKKIAEQAERGKTSPYFLECVTSRWKEHVGPGDDFNLGYRSKEEVDQWKKKDPVLLVGKKLSASDRTAIEKEVESRIAEAIRFAEESPEPPKEDLLKDLFQPRLKPASTDKIPVELTREIIYPEAVREALDYELKKDPSVVVYGLDVTDPKAILGTTRDLEKTYGSDRVFGTPLAEDAMTGAGIGMAIAGLRPVHIHIRMDFLLLAMNQLMNIAAKTSYVFAGQASVPMVIRAMIGRSWGQGAQHSQAFHSFFMHVPGIKVVAPSNPYDAKGCMTYAIRDQNPVVFIEHRLLYYKKSPVPAADYEVGPGSARVSAVGKDVTLLGVSYMQLECIRAATYLKKFGIEAEVIDPIWLSPFDMETVIKSVEKTRRLVIADNGWLTCSMASEVAAKVAAHFEGQADIKVRTLGFAEVPCPTAPSLEEDFYPDPIAIASMAHQLVKGTPLKQDPNEIFNWKEIEFKGPF